MSYNDEVLISVRNIWKTYNIYDEPKDRLLQMFLRNKKLYREFHALQNVSFDVKKGETIGILGHNGAGKSTLLQIICNTLEPSNGNVEVNGKVAALLELGAGFNPDFSGHENVILNAKLLGLSDCEISNKYNEIIKFADIGDFINQPVKTYSSGMYVRLAFAVQACIEPEILIVDEALSVGDIGFQFKCFQRMKKLKENGTTIILVTHSTGSILEYADRCIVMKAGKVHVDTTDVLSAVLAYEKGMLEQQTIDSISAKEHKDNIVTKVGFSVQQLKNIQLDEINKNVDEKRFGSARAILKKIEVINNNNQNYHDVPLLNPNKEVCFRFEIWSSESIENVVLGISISKNQGSDIWGDNNLKAGTKIDLEKGKQFIEYTVNLPISSGEYLLHCGLAKFINEEREELDQRRPVESLKFWHQREQGGSVFAPIIVKFIRD